MAELLGVPIFYSQIPYGRNTFPQLGRGSSGPPGLPGSGTYYGFSLNHDHLERDEKVMRLRPTGPSGSGPYFNAQKSGMYGVRAASRLTVSGNGTKDYIRLCKYSQSNKHDTGPGGRLSWSSSYLFCDGETVVAWSLACTEDSYYSTMNWVAYSIRPHRAPHPTGMYRTYGLKVDFPRLNFGNFDYIKEYYERATWEAISSINIGHNSPDLVSWDSRAGVYSGETVSLSDGDLIFDHDELSHFEWWDLTGSLEGPYRAVAGNAYYEACNSLPKSFNNSIANILELAGSIKDIIHGDFGKLIPRNPKDAWLFYRYQYSTTKLDLEEYAELTRNLAAIVANPIIRSDGFVSNYGISCHCEIQVDAAQIIPDDSRKWLESYGIKLNSYDIWDLLPYSFVVDWFFHIGNFLELMERDNWAYSLNIREAWTSFTTHGPGSQTTYFRIPGYYRAAAPFLDYRGQTASGKTIVKRVLDSIALFT